jgi:hypothetical protein
VGLTPFQVKSKAGTYIFEVEKINFKPKFLKVIVADGEKKNIEVKLDEITSSVLIDSVPQGALVEIEGRQIGQTPVIVHDQKIGSYKATLKKPGMVPQELNWVVEDARPQTVKGNLFSNMGVIKINVSPASAQISIDGKSKGKSPFTENIEQGEHVVLIEATGYEKHEQNVIVEKEKESLLNIALNILPATMNVSTEPNDAMIFLDGKQIGRSPLSIPGLQPRKYQIKAEKDGYDLTSKDVEISAGASVDVVLNLDTNMGGIDIVINPPGITIYLDGKKIGKSEQGESEKLSKVFQIRGLTHGNHLLKVSHARAVPQDTEINIEVVKGQITRSRPVNMWIADCIIKFKNGKERVGRMREENDKQVFFEPEPGVAINYGMNEILSIKRFKIDE